ncbi:hypothetical protein R6Q59_016395 [Mikania micrantha]
MPFLVSTLQIVRLRRATDFYFLFVALDYTHHDHATTNSETTAEVYAVTTTSAANDCSAAVQIRQFPMTGLGQNYNINSTNLQGLYHASFKVSDVYGIFQFKVEYQTLGYTSLPLAKQDRLREAILLVFVNKQDLPNAMDAAEITDKLGLHTL